MPRKVRIDVSGAVHHVIDRRINRQRIFSDTKDYERLKDGAKGKYSFHPKKYWMA